jgi:hypothetical protein
VAFDLLVNLFTVKLNNQGGITLIVNGKVGAAHIQGKPVRMS